MKRSPKSNDQSRPDVTELLEEILTDVHGDDEELRAFHRAFENVALPADGFVLGEPVSVTAIDYDGNPRRGLTVRCRREDGEEHVVALADLGFAEAGEAGRTLAAYRTWMNLGPLPPGPSRKGKPRRHQVVEGDIDLSGPAELVALTVRQETARCRLLGRERTITLRASGMWKVAPGHILTIQPRKQWRYGGHPYLSGEIQSTRVDVPALGLVPLRLDPCGEWDPEEHYWGEEGEPIEEWAEPLIAAGRRPQFEMEQIRSGTDPYADPILDSLELKESGDLEGAREMLADILQADLRTLDAHAHLGNCDFESRPHEAINNYEIGFRIGELSLGEGFRGVLPWGLIDNRPFLRCMQSYALCLWRLDHHDEAAELFERLLWLNPTDNQGCRLLLPAVRAGESWDSQPE